VNRYGTDKALSDGHAPLQQEGANLIDNAGALADQSFTHAMQRLQVKLIGGLRRHKLHRRALNGNIDPPPARQDDVARDQAQIPFLAAVSLDHILGADRKAAKSSSALAFKTRRWRPRACAAACRSVSWGSVIGLFGFASTPMMVAAGISSSRRPSRFVASSTPNRVIPVILPPGRLRLATKPNLTRSPPITKIDRKRVEMLFAHANAGKLMIGISSERRAAVHAFHCQAHYFVTAAWKVLEHRKWVAALNLCKNVDFSEIDGFPEDDIRDLRNMREHVVEYFQGVGINKDRWWKETPEYKADASSMVGTMIGGRLDWKAFSAAAAKLLPQLNEPIPFPPTDRGRRAP
jgi:hypothetical protein